MEREQASGAITKSLWINSAIVSRTMDNTLGANHGIGMAEYMVLESLMNAPNHCMRRVDIAEALARTASGITRMLLPMEKIGLIAKETNERDARVSLVKITAAGEEMYQNATVTLNRRANALFRRLDDTKATKLLSLLDAV